MTEKYFILLIISFLIFSCGKEADKEADKKTTEIRERVDEISDSVVSKYSDVLENASEKYGYAKDDYFLIINATEQKMYLIKDSKTLFEYIISSGKAGEGQIEGSGKTPLGYHKIVEKIGDGAKIGTIFVGKKNTGKISPIYTDKTDIKNDPVVTRILSLDGLEKGYNKGGNVDSYKRAIYIHGTHEEGLLGTKSSHGCIRMNNEEVISLFDTVSNGVIVYITK